MVGGGADNAAASVGSGVVTPGTLQTSIGTSGAVVAPIDRSARRYGYADPFLQPRRRWRLVPDGRKRCRPGRRWVGTGARWPGPGNSPPEYEELIAEADATEPGANGLTFLPYLTGERTPHADSNARGAFSGLNVAHSRGHLTRAILEGVTFALRDSLELMRKLGVDATEVVAVGGGARSAAWRQMQADVLGVPVVRVGPSGGAAYGAAILAAVGAGRFGSVRETCDSWIRPIDRVEPRPELAEPYDRAYSRFRELYPRLKRHFRRLGGVTSAFPDLQRRLGANPHGLFACARAQRGVADFVAALPRTRPRWACTQADRCCNRQSP